MFFPEKTETFNSEQSMSEVIEKITSDIESIEDDKQWFKGAIKDSGFEISLILKRPNNFVPIISGLIEKEEKGKTIILVRYQLFPATKKFLVFWTVLTLLLTLFFAIPYHAYLYAAITLSACFVNYIITRENFNIQVRKSRRALRKLIED